MLSDWQVAGQTTWLWLVDWTIWSCQLVSLQTPQSSAWVSTKLPHFTPVSPGRPAVGQRLDRTSWWRVERLRSLAWGLSQPPQPHQHTGDRMSYFKPSQTISDHRTASNTISYHHSPQLTKTQYYTTETVLKLTQSYQLTSESKYSVKGIVPSQTRFNMDMDHPPYLFSFFN